MSTTYDLETEYAKALGYDTPGKAISSVGPNTFKQGFKKFKESHNTDLNLPHTSGKTEHNELKKKYRNNVLKVEIGFNNNYVLFRDGKCFSKKYNKFLKPCIQTDDTGRQYALYTLGRGKRFLINRLIYFYFGNHPYTDISKMPSVSPINRNSLDWRLENLEIVTQKEVNIKYEISTPEQIKIPEKEKENVIAFLKARRTISSIAKWYGVERASIYRFISRHNLSKYKVQRSKNPLL